MSRIKRGKDWIDEGPSSHHGVRGLTSGGVPVSRAMPSLIGAIKKNPSKRKRDSELAKERRIARKTGGWSAKPINRVAGKRFELSRRVNETERDSKGNQNTTA